MVKTKNLSLPQLAFDANPGIVQGTDNTYWKRVALERTTIRARAANK